MIFRIFSLLRKFSPLFIIFDYYCHLFRLKVKKQHDLISVVVPLYNEERFIIEALISVKRQSYKNFECLIVNDCSTDDSLKLASSFCKKDERFRIITHEENRGLSASRNTGMKKSKGEYILFLDSDDVLTKHSLLFKWEKLKNSHPYTIASTSRILYCQEDRVSISKRVRSFLPSMFKQYLHFSNWNYMYPFMVHGLLFKSSEVKAFSGFNESMRSGCEDYEFWMRILRHGYIFESSREIGGYYRQKQGSMLLGNHSRHFQVLSSLIEKNTKDCLIQEVEKCPYFFSRPQSFYKSEYAKFDRHIRFSYYLNEKHLENSNENDRLYMYFSDIYSVNKIKSFLNAVYS